MTLKKSSLFPKRSSSNLKIEDQKAKDGMLNRQKRYVCSVHQEAKMPAAKPYCVWLPKTGRTKSSSKSKGLPSSSSRRTSSMTEDRYRILSGIDAWLDRDPVEDRLDERELLQGRLRCISMRLLSLIRCCLCASSALLLMLDVTFGDMVMNMLWNRKEVSERSIRYNTAKVYPRLAWLMSGNVSAQQIMGEESNFTNKNKIVWAVVGWWVSAVLDGVVQGKRKTIPFRCADLNKCSKNIGSSCFCFQLFKKKKWPRERVLEYFFCTLKYGHKLSEKFEMVANAKTKKFFCRIQRGSQSSEF